MTTDTTQMSPYSQKRAPVNRCTLKRILFCLLLLIPKGVFGQGYSKEDAVKKMTFQEGLTGTLFAAEPEVRQPIFCKCDDRGRLWTIQYLQYPNPAGLKRVKVDRYSRTVYDQKPLPPPQGPVGADRITILEDTDGDGRADRFKDFVTGLNLCTGVEFGNSGVYVIQAPYLLFYPDRNRDDVPDSDPQVLLDGFGIEDAQSLANHLTWGPDGWLYGLNGSTTTCNIRGIEFQQGVWRYHPNTKEFELFCEGGGNIFGLTFDRWGRLIYSSNGGLCYHGVQGAYFEKNFGKHGPLHNPHTYGYFSHVRHQGLTGRPNTGATIYLGDTFPAAMRDSLIVGDFLTHTCSWWKLQPRGSTIQATLGGLVVDSHDTWFGATDVCLGSDGAIFVTDFHDQRTAHPDPDAQWDTSNGRIYRIQASGAKSRKPVDLNSLSSEELVATLSDSDGWRKHHARRILSSRVNNNVEQLLRSLALQKENVELALQGLWTLHGNGKLDSDLAEPLMSHPSEMVRAWTVRLLGDRGWVTAAMAARLESLAKDDSSVEVRSQLASTAKRLPAGDALPILSALAMRDLDENDPYIPLLIWWGLENKAIPYQNLVLSRFAKPESWEKRAPSRLLRLLMRRYAAEGWTQEYSACQEIWESAPEKERASLLEPLLHGLTQRSRTENAPVTAPLKSILHQVWNEKRDDSVRIRIGLEAGDDDVYRYLIQGISKSEPLPMLTERLKMAAEYGKEDSIQPLLSLLDSDQPETVRMASLSALQRFGNENVTERILSLYPEMPAALKSRSRTLLFCRSASSLAFLKTIESRMEKPTEIPLEQVQVLSLLQNDEVNSLVKKYWGNVKPGTPEEKLADVRRFSNDLRASSGDPVTGKVLFQKNCGTCHKLYGEGASLGPDLSGTVKGDQASLLANIVDPNSVIRREFLNYTLATKYGVIYTGLMAEQDAAGVTLVDTKNQR
ncbi:MAG: c-type cytochrome, partial [Planctomycetes bacterium]|nr:c-type cytochrome [Planctomycetota bacterium]